MKPARYSDIEEWQQIEWKWEEALNDFPSPSELREYDKIVLICDFCKEEITLGESRI